MAAKYRLIHPVKYYSDFSSKNIRPDGREFSKLRPIAINSGSILTSNGSSVVKVGNTTVVCGIRLELAKPRAATPEHGFIIPNVDFHHSCSAKQRSDPVANDESDVISYSIYDALLNSNSIDLKELCIYKEKLVWAVYFDIITLETDGCVFDASLLACFAALKVLRLPKIIYDADINNIKVNSSVPMQALTINQIPISTTSLIIENDEVITDPTAEEEALAVSMVKVTICNSKVSAILKNGGSPLSKEIMNVCINRAFEKAENTKTLFNRLQV